MDLMWVKTNRLIKWIFPKYIWEIPNSGKKIYLTFDDGPIPEVTEWVLELLKKHSIKATFFCIGDNIKKHPELFERVIREGHSIGNHTFNHIKGWDFSKEEYIENALLCEKEMIAKGFTLRPKIFRPPYGKIKPSQSKILRKMGYRIIMWDVLSVDYDKNVSPKQCLENIIKNTVSGSVIACHDSLKAFKNLEYALPRAIEYLKEKGFSFERID